MKKLYQTRGQKKDATGRVAILVRMDPEMYRAIEKARGPRESRGEWLRKVAAEALKTQAQ